MLMSFKHNCTVVCQQYTVTVLNRNNQHTTQYAIFERLVRYIYLSSLSLNQLFRHVFLLKSPLCYVINARVQVHLAEYARAQLVRCRFGSLIESNHLLCEHRIMNFCIDTACVCDFCIEVSSAMPGRTKRLYNLQY